MAQVLTLLIVWSFVVGGVTALAGSILLGALFALGGWFMWGNLARLTAERESRRRRTRPKLTARDVPVMVFSAVLAYLVVHTASDISAVAGNIAVFAGWVLLVDVSLRFTRSRETQHSEHAAPASL